MRLFSFPFISLICTTKERGVVLFATDLSCIAVRHGSVRRSRIFRQSGVVGSNGLEVKSKTLGFPFFGCLLKNLLFFIFSCRF